MLAVFPVLGGLRGMEPLQRRRQVERVRRLSGVSSIARAMEQVYLPDAGPDPEKDRTEEGSAGHLPSSPLLLTQLPLLQRFRAAEIEAMALAMIGAALADGHVDAEERLRMLRLLREAGGDRQTAMFLQRHLDDPVDPTTIAAQIEDREAAAEIYGAALLAIVLDSDGERAYLARLATALALPEASVADLHHRAGIGPPIAPPSHLAKKDA